MTKMKEILLKIINMKYGRIILFLAISLGCAVLTSILSGIMVAVLGFGAGLTGLRFLDTVSRILAFVLAWAGITAAAFGNWFVTFRSSAPWYFALLMIPVRIVFELLASGASALAGMLNGSLYSFMRYTMDMRSYDARNMVELVYVLLAIVFFVLGWAIWLAASYAVQHYVLYAKTMDKNNLLQLLGAEAPAAQEPVAEVAAEEPAAPVMEAPVDAEPSDPAEEA